MKEKVKKAWETTKRSGPMIIMLFIIVWLAENGNTLGWYAFFGGIIAFSALIIWKSWPTIMLGVRNLETQYFDKPLDKEYWKKGERPKVEFVWKDKEKK